MVVLPEACDISPRRAKGFLTWGRKNKWRCHVVHSHTFGPKSLENNYVSLSSTMVDKYEPVNTVGSHSDLHYSNWLLRFSAFPLESSCGNTDDARRASLRTKKKHDDTALKVKQEVRKEPRWESKSKKKHDRVSCFRSFRSPFAPRNKDLSCANKGGIICQRWHINNSGLDTCYLRSDR